jgi:hypothetical protein
MKLRLKVPQFILDRTRHQPRTQTQEEYESNFRSVPAKLTLRWIFLGIGIILSIFSVVYFVLGIKVDWFVLKIAYEDNIFEMNLSQIFAIPLLAIGLWFITRVNLNPNALRENTTYFPHLSKRKEPLLHKARESADVENTLDFVKLRSFPTDRFLAATLMLAMGVWNVLNFGFFLTGENDVGNWLVLGGPSIFFPTSLFPMVIALGLLVYCCGAGAIITFSKTPHFYTIEEYRFLAPWMTEIPRDKVIAVRMQNNRTGPKFVWIFMFGLHMIWLLEDGLHFVLNPFSFGTSYLVGYSYIATALVQLVALLILTFRTQNFLEIVTEDKRYELQFSPPAVMPNITATIEQFFGLPALIEPRHRYRQFNTDPRKENNIFPKFKQHFLADWRQMLTGLVFISLAVWSKINGMFAGDPLRLVLLMYGFYLFLKGYKEDWSSPRHPMRFHLDGETKQFFYRKDWGVFTEVYRFEKCTPDNLTIQPRLGPLNVFDAILAPLLFAFLTITTVSYFRVVPLDGSLAMHELMANLAVLHIVFYVLLCWLILVVYLRPLNSVHLTTPMLEFDFQVPGVYLTSQWQAWAGKSWFTRQVQIWLTIWQNPSQRTGLLVRLVILVGSLVFGLFYVIYLI